MNLPQRFALWADGSCAFVHDLGESWSDTEIWDHAAKHDLTIVSKDSDFSSRVMLSTDGPKVIHIRVGNMRIAELHAFLGRVWGDVCELSEKNRLVQVYSNRIETIE
ncbi:MAG: DUF5615 family PIN-like protein [Alphaproteobacteria bacterium]|nr:DUF5615 family PIN-like protein [Alphaproteobacteria bacterium]